MPTGSAPSVDFRVESSYQLLGGGEGVPGCSARLWCRYLDTQGRALSPPPLCLQATPFHTVFRLSVASAARPPSRGGQRREGGASAATTTTDARAAGVWEALRTAVSVMRRLSGGVGALPLSEVFSRLDHRGSGYVPVKEAQTTLLRWLHNAAAALELGGVDPASSSSSSSAIEAAQLRGLNAAALRHFLRSTVDRDHDGYVDIREFLALFDDGEDEDEEEDETAAAAGVGAAALPSSPSPARGRTRQRRRAPRDAADAALETALNGLHDMLYVSRQTLSELFARLDTDRDARVTLRDMLRVLPSATAVVSSTSSLDERGVRVLWDALAALPGGRTLDAAEGVAFARFERVLRPVPCPVEGDWQSAALRSLWEGLRQAWVVRRRMTAREAFRACLAAAASAAKPFGAGAAASAAKPVRDVDGVRGLTPLGFAALARTHVALPGAMRRPAPPVRRRRGRDPRRGGQQRARSLRRRRWWRRRRVVGGGGGRRVSSRPGMALRRAEHGTGARGPSRPEP